MTMPDLPERPEHPSDTRQMVERGRTQTGGEVSTRQFFIALAAIALAIAGLALLLR
jgi:hypothetical protein